MTNLELEINTDKYIYQQGENVHITATLRNKSSMNLQLTIIKFMSDNLISVEIENSEGMVVCNNSRGTCGVGDYKIEIDANSSITEVNKWDQKERVGISFTGIIEGGQVPPGEYTIHAFVNMSENNSFFVVESPPRIIIIL